MKPPSYRGDSGLGSEGEPHLLEKGKDADRQLAQGERRGPSTDKSGLKSQVSTQLCNLGQVTSPLSLNIFTCNWGLTIPLLKNAGHQMR